MRIIAGTHGGRRLKSIDAPELRPTTDRVRESIFNMLASRIEFEGARVLDLFAGTGALGIEALSRGAVSCTFVEKNRKTAAVIRENLATLDLLDNNQIVIGDVLAFLRDNTGQFDLVFADPPYAAAIFDRLVHDLFSLQRIADDGLFVLEHGSFMKGARSQLAEIIVEKSFGDTGVTVYRQNHLVGAGL
jgi:16S rRNA (guanine966-N2)-methyltransferase